MENELNSGMGTQSSFGPGIEEQHQDLGGLPGGNQAGIRGMASQAGEKLMESAERQKVAGADFVSGLAETARRAADDVEGQSPTAASYIRSAADQVESFSDSLRRRDMGQMVSDVQSFARNQPTAFLGISFLAGFAAVRFLRSGSAGAGSNPRSWQGGEAVDQSRYGNPSTGVPGMRAPGGGGLAVSASAKTRSSKNDKMAQWSGGSTWRRHFGEAPASSRPASVFR